MSAMDSPQYYEAQFLSTRVLWRNTVYSLIIFGAFDVKSGRMKIRDDSAVAGKNKMKNQTAAAVATVTQVINWDKLDLQVIVEAGNKGLLGGPLTEWLARGGWVTVTNETETPAPLTSYRKGLKLNATKAVAMDSLFKNGNGVVYCDRDGDLDNWFTANCQEGKAGTFEIVKTPKVMTFRQMAQSATGNSSESLAELSRAIVTQGRDVTPAQWEQQIIATQKDEDILLTNGYANFAFTKTGKVLKDDAGSDYKEIVVLYAYRDDDGSWYAGVRQLGSSRVWDAGIGLVLSNKN